MNWRWVMGKNCIKEILKSDPSRFLKIYTASRQDPLIDQIEKETIPLSFVSKKKLASLVLSDSHQQFIGQVQPLDLPPFKDWLTAQKEKTLVILCDSIEDPHNLGAIFRVAECFQAGAILFSKNRSAPISPAVAKVSVGASELVPMFAVSNLADAARTLQKDHFSLIGAHCHPQAVPLSNWEFPDRSALVLGSEGKGIRPLLARLCDVHLSIPLFGQIESLNVSQAAAILLSKWGEKLHQPD